MPVDESTDHRSLTFYQFLGLHSLLIGIFPFFIPVYLWNHGYSLGEISIFIAITGASFCAFLRLWELVAARFSVVRLFSLTLLLEVVLLLVNQTGLSAAPYLIVFGIANGLYNCFFWTTQRVLFVDIISESNSGRQYGNFQIFVMVFLKIGILIGGLLLENLGFIWIIVASTLIAAAGSVYFQRTIPSNQRLDLHRPTHIREVITFKDNHRSRTVFILDGLFLFLESHFWTVSLFLVSNENFAQLGLMVIVLAVLFSIIFYLTKNLIDQLMGRRIYQAAVILYAASWLGRSLINEEGNTQMTLILLLLITFSSSFFRLTFNKRFYDLAATQGARRYLIIKSYITQFSVTVIFSAIACTLFLFQDSAAALPIIYLAATLLALLYVRYQR